MSLIQEKIKQFKKDLKGYPMDERQKRLYKSFIRTSGNPSSFSAIDKEGKIVKFKLRSDSTTEGTQHILLKHYRGFIGKVTAIEIISMFEVIEKGNKAKDSKSITYTMKKNYPKGSLIVGIKITAGQAVLKSFYSNRK